MRWMVWMCMVPGVAFGAAPGLESQFGATNVHAAVGNGELVATWSAKGELTGLRWPNATFSDQLHYATAALDDGWALAFMGASENDGAFDGVRIGAEPDVFWLREGPWLLTVAYAGPDSEVVERRYEWGTRRVVCAAFVEVGRPVLRRRCELFGDDVHTYVGYLNSALLGTHKAFDASDQYALDDSRESALRWEAEVSAFVDVADGVAMVVGVDPKPEQVQAGMDSGGTPMDAYVGISGSKQAMGAVNLAYRVAAKVVETRIAFGVDEGAALAALAASRGEDYEAARAAREAAGRASLAGLVVPDGLTGAEVEVVKRAVLSVRSGTVASGGVVESLASQPPLSGVSVRSGVVFGAFLERTGQVEAARALAAFVAGLQRTAVGEGALAGDAPVGSWAAGYYADGGPAATPDFGMDTVGWGLVLLARYGAEEAAVEAAIGRAADLLVSCVEPGVGLPCVAEEGRGGVPTQTLRGAIAVWAGLDAAVARGAGAVGAWAARRDELAAAMTARWLTEATLAESGDEALAEVLWPARFPVGEGVKAAIVARLEGTLRNTVLERNPPGRVGVPALLMALVWAAPEAGPARTTARAVLAEVCEAVVTPGTWHLGQGMVPEGAKGWRNHSGMPYLPAAARVGLAALTTWDHPEAVVVVVPPAADADTGSAAVSDAGAQPGCAMGRHGRGAGGWLLAGLFGLMWRRRFGGTARSWCCPVSVAHGGGSDAVEEAPDNAAAPAPGGLFDEAGQRAGLGLGDIEGEAAAEGVGGPVGGLGGVPQDSPQAAADGGDLVELGQLVGEDQDAVVAGGFDVAGGPNPARVPPGGRALEGPGGGLIARLSARNDQELNQCVL